MDRKLVAWARAVKARRPRSPQPALFLFLDDRIADPVAAVGRFVTLPGAHALCAVVLRARDRDRRLGLARALLPLCRGRHVPLLVGGDVRLARRLGLGSHRPASERAGRRRASPRRWLTASAHGVATLRRAGGAPLRFVSPVFATASHPGAPALGPHRLARIAVRAPRGIAVAALGGIDGQTVRRLPRTVRAIGAVDSLAGRAPAR